MRIGEHLGVKPWQNLETNNTLKLSMGVVALNFHIFIPLLNVFLLDGND